MKQYITYYQPIAEHQKTLDAGGEVPGNLILYDIGMHHNPDLALRFATEQEAEGHLLKLRALNVRKGDRVCQLALEQLDEKYAIVCDDSPEP